MWIKLFLLLVYICLLFLLSRVLETISWCDLAPSRVLSRQLLDPMRLSVAKLKCLLDHRGVSYDGIVEKSELTGLMEASGPVNVADIDMSCQEEATMAETNFTSGAHFIEQVEDAKDSVWLVQVVTQTEQTKVVMNRRWKHIQRKASQFGVRTGLLDCSLDVRYCYSKGWKMPVMLLALPRVFEKKANVIMYNYSGPATESAIMRWIHDKLDSKVMRIKDLSLLQEHSFKTLQPEIQAILFTQALTAPLFFSALSVKFPGRVKFGLVTVDDKKDDSKSKKTFLKKLTERYNIAHLPMIIIYTAEGNYTYGFRSGEKLSFTNMEIFLKFLYPCLNDIFIISFCVANVVSWLEFFVSNCGLFKRIRKLIWCVLTYNIMVIMLWLPVIGLFQMPYLDQVPLLLLKLHRIFTTSDIGAILRGDYVFFVSNPIYVYMSFVGYLILVTLLCKKYRQVEDESEDWFNFRQMQTLTHLRANNLFDPMRVSSYDLVGGFEVFGSRFSQHSLWLQPSIPLEYIQHLPTWRYTPQTMASRAAQNATKVESAMVSACSENCHSSTKINTDPLLPCSSDKEHTAMKMKCDSCRKCRSVSPSCKVVSSTHTISYPVRTNPPNAPKLSTSKDPNQRLSTCSECGSVPHENRAHHSSSSIAHPSSLEQANVPEPENGRPPIHQDNSNPNITHQTDFSPANPSPNQSMASTSLTDEIQYSSPPCSSDNTLQPEVLPNGFRKGFMESNQCVICLDDYAPLTMLCGLPCGHVFHETCIISWLNREKHFCPMCRWPSYKLYVCPNPS